MPGVRIIILILLTRFRNQDVIKDDYLEMVNYVNVY